MNDFYLEMQGVANEVLTEFNQGQISYVIDVPGNGPADDPGAPVPNTTPLGAATARGVQFTFVSGNVLASDLQITIPGGIIVPAPEGYFTIDGARYKIVEIKQVPAAGTPVVWIVIVRK
jgi:hypothetical protein